jgi:hypothetical protein
MAETSRGIEKALDDYRTLGVTTLFGDWLKDVNGIACAFQFACKLCARVHKG